MWSSFLNLCCLVCLYCWKWEVWGVLLERVLVICFCMFLVEMSCLPCHCWLVLCWDLQWWLCQYGMVWGFCVSWGVYDVVSFMRIICWMIYLMIYCLVSCGWTFWCHICSCLCILFCISGRSVLSCCICSIFVLLLGSPCCCGCIHIYGNSGEWLGHLDVLRCV